MYVRYLSDEEPRIERSMSQRIFSAGVSNVELCFVAIIRALQLADNG